MKTKKQIPYIWLGPIFTLLIMLVLYAISGIYPFGTNTTAFSDGFAQYVAFLSEFANKIKEGSSLLFTWNMGGGVNFWATISYYLASPLSLIALFFEPEEMPNAFSLITLIKPILMSLTFGIFLKYVYKKNDLTVAIFSTLWALSGFMIAVIYITSWYDAIIYFPLVIMGLNKMMNGGSAWFYALFLGLTIASNFYIGWMVCIFCVIYFVYCFISDDEVTYEGTVNEEQQHEETDSVNIFAVFKNSYLLGSMFKFAVSSLLAGGISAIMTLPMISVLSNTAKGTTESNTIVVEGVWGILASHIFPPKHEYFAMGSNAIVFAFAGIATLILAVVYFFNKGISVRKKAGNIFLLLVMWASMTFYPLWFAWHGFSEPAGVTYRFAFIYSFVLIKIAYEAIVEIKKTPIYAFIGSTLIAGLCVAGIYLHDDIKNEFYLPQIVGAVIVFAVIFTAILIVMSKKPKLTSAMTIILAVVVLAESVVLRYDIFKYYDVNADMARSSNTKKAIEHLVMGEKMTFVDDNIEYDDVQMYGALYGYPAFECYSSVFDGKFDKAITYMGVYGNRMNLQNGGQEQTPIFNCLFPTAYYLDGTRDIEESEYRTKIYEDNGYTLYKNNYTMPFMYTVSNDILDWSPLDYVISIDCQNSAFKALTGTNEMVLTYNENTNFSYENCEGFSYAEKMIQHYEDKGVELSEGTKEYYQMLEDKMKFFAFEIHDLSKPAYVTYESIATEDGHMFMFVDTDEFTSMTVKINGKTRECFLYGVGENRTYDFGEVKAGDVATITIGGHLDTSEVQYGSGNVYAVKENAFSAICFTVNNEKFKAGYNKLDSMSDTELLEFEDTYVKAKVTSHEDGMLYIPTSYDEGWTLLVDGKEAPLHEHESHILMTEITEGEHIVEMKYCPVGFVSGAVITGVSVAILIAWAVISTKRSKKEEMCATIEQTSVNEE